MRPEGAAEAERPGVSAVIATRNRREALEIVLDRLAELPVDEVLVVDNGSEDDTLERLSTREGNVRVFAQETNRGLAGRNFAAREARNDLLLVLDDDAYPLPGAIETLIERFEQNARLAAGGGLVRDIDANGRVLRSTELGTFDWWLRAGMEGDAPPEGFPAFFFPEGAAMVRRSAYLEVGGYFEPYFHTVEGIDLTTRLLAAGWDVRYFPDARFDHMKAQWRPRERPRALPSHSEQSLVPLAALPRAGRGTADARLPGVRPGGRDLPTAPGRVGPGRA